MNKHITSISIALILFSGLCSGDVFKHRLSGEVFYGYPTNRTLGRKTRIYAQENGKFVGKTIIIDEYDVTYDPKGRKDNLIVIGIDHRDILLSDTVSKSLAKTIIEGANKGPRYIILEIDSPGGNGDCMKIVCDAIKKTSNCPIIAFISGKQYGGAYSAAAGVALACDKIYIAPDAEIGTLCPQIDATSSDQNLSEWKDMFTPASIASFGGYLVKFSEKKNRFGTFLWELEKKKRPAAMMMAMVDQNIEIVEVVIDEQGSRNIVHKAEKSPKDAIIKTWSRTIKVASPENKNDQPDEFEQTESQITLSADDAIYTRMADKILPSRIEVIEDLDASDTKILNTTRIKSLVRKFTQSRFSIARNYQAITMLEQEAAEIEGEIKAVITQARKNMPTMEDERLKQLQRKIYQNQLNDRSRDRRNFDNTYVRRGDRRSLSRREMARLEDEVQDTYINPYLFEQQRLAMELVGVLNELLDNYVNVNKLARQFPGALPEGKTLQALQQKYNIAFARRNYIIGYN